MSRPSTEAEYLARMIPDSFRATQLSRRGLLRGAAGAGAALSLPALLAACGGSSSSGGSGTAGTTTGTVSFGSNQSDVTP